MTKTQRIIGVVCTLSLLAMTYASGGFCNSTAQTRVACEDHVGMCQSTAWNYKIYYTKTYECCYNEYGQFTHRNVGSNVGPTSPVDGDCCRSLETVTFTDGKWGLPCPQTATPPSNN